MEAVGLVIYDLFLNGKLYEGGAVLLQLDAWLREQDWCLLRRADVAEGPDGERCEKGEAGVRRLGAPSGWTMPGRHKCMRSVHCAYRNSNWCASEC